MSILRDSPHARSRAFRTFKDKYFVVFCIASAFLSILVLGILLTSIGVQGTEYLTKDLLSNSPSRKPEQAGIYPAMWGTIMICMVCAATAIPLGVGTAIFLEEYKPRNKWLMKFHSFVQVNITNLSGVPSVVYGILGLTVFAQMFNWGWVGTADEPWLEIGTYENWYYFRLPIGRSVLAGGLTLMLLVLPVIIISSQEALRAVPDSLRKGALALGATRWQMIWRMTLPSAIPGIMTGTILSMSRAIGEAAPILIICGVAYITFTPEHLMDDFTAMPLQIYNWAARPQEEFHQVAASGIIVLMGILLTFNAVAIIIRQKFQKQLS